MIPEPPREAKQGTVTSSLVAILGHREVWSTHDHHSSLVLSDALKQKRAPQIDNTSTSYCNLVAYLEESMDDINVTEDVRVEDPFEGVHGLALEGAHAGDASAANHGAEFLLG